jgi:Flp pilus assembly protein CpaB
MALSTSLRPPADAPNSGRRRDRLDAERSGRRPHLAPERPLRAAAGLLVVVACAAVGAAVAGRSGRTEAVLEVARPVATGIALGAEDLEVVDLVPSPRLRVVPATALGSVVGQPARVPLVPGALLVPGDLGAGPRVPPDSALVGTSLAPDEVPSGLAPGDEVLVVPSGAGQPAGELASASDPVGSSLRPAVLAQATVIAVEQPGTTSPTGDELVTLAVPRSAAADVAAASAAGDVSLAELVPGGSR